MPDGLDEVACSRLFALEHAVLEWVRGDWPGLTNRQLALLMIVSIEPGRHAVSTLAERLDVTPPIVSRILDRLSLLGLIMRQGDRRDRRIVFAVPTERATAFLTDLSDRMTSN